MSIEVSEEAGVRYLHFGSHWIQGAMRIARPWSLELAYTRDLMFPLLLRDRDDYPRSALLIGLGAGSLPKFLHRHRPAARICVMEIDATVVDAARGFFRLPESSDRLSIEIGEAGALVARSRDSYDLIVVDGYDARGRVGALDSLAFYRNCAARLTRRGMLATNLVVRSRGIKPSLDRMRLAFHDRVVALPVCDSGNQIALAAVGERMRISPSELKARAQVLRERTGLDLRATAGGLLEQVRKRGLEL